MSHNQPGASITALLLITLCLGACTAPAAAPTQVVEPTSPATQPPTALPVPATRAPTAIPPSLTPSPAPSEADIFPLAEPGPYFPGRRTYAIPYSRVQGAGQVGITIWYPAVKPADFKGTVAKEAPADQDGASYPLLLTSTIFGNEFATHLASHGFVVAGVDNQAPSDRFGPWVIDYPLEILAMLDYLADTPPVELAGVIDADHSGALGYSFSGHNTLLLSGARVDAQFYLDKCAQGPAEGSSPTDKLVKEQTYHYFCEMASSWEDFASHAGSAITASDDGLWQALLDDRIRAAMPMAPDGPWLFGERGLAAIKLPVLMICGTADSRDTDYLESCAYAFERIGSPEKGLISFVNQDHLMVFDAERQRRMQHFIAAFFGYHLQGKTEYQEYYAQEFVEQVGDLAWGVYPTP
jgi:predicted dienelactone hydrolase